MHIGNYLKEKVYQQRYSVAQIADMISKTEPAVRKDFEKERLHMNVLEAFAKALNINIYEVLAKEWSGEEPEPEKPYEWKSNEPDQEPYKKADPQTAPVSVTFNIDQNKKDQLIKLLFS